MNWIVSPKFYCPFAIWPWIKISPHSSLNVIYCLIITTWQWLMSFTNMPCILMQIKPIKACQGWGRSPLERVAMLSLWWSLWICLVSATTLRTLLAGDCITEVLPNVFGISDLSGAASYLNPVSIFHIWVVEKIELIWIVGTCYAPDLFTDFVHDHSCLLGDVNGYPLL